MTGNVRLPWVVTVMLCVLPVAAAWAQEGESRHAPRVLPGVEEAMLTPDYWIGRQDNPDEIIMNSQDIAAFNTYVREKNVVFEDRFGKPDPMLENYEQKRSIGLLMHPILPLEQPDDLEGRVLRDRLREQREYLYSRDFYDGRNVRWSPTMKDDLAAVMNMGEIGETVTRLFGVCVRRSDIRLFPTAVPGYSDTRWALDFFQTTAVYTLTPVAVLHRSVDGAYYYCETPIARGWIAAENVALAPRDEIRELVDTDKFIMATGSRVPLYGDPDCTRFIRYLYFSARLPLIERTARGTVATLPRRGSDGGLEFSRAYVGPGGDIHEGYLPYTKRNVLNQIFKLLGEPYGWADQDEKRDCSGTQRVLLKCFGIVTGRWPNFILLAPPREHRTYIDPDWSESRIREVVAAIEPVITFAGTGGHIVLYLGQGHNGELYFLHQCGWGYDEGDVHYYVNRVAVNAASHDWYDITRPRVYATFRYAPE